MAETAAPGEPEPAALRRALHQALRRERPQLRIVAEGFQALCSEIDLLAIGVRGELVSVRIARTGEDRSLIGRALSDLVWLAGHAAGLARLAPQLGIDARQTPTALLVARDFDDDTRSATTALTPGRITLLRQRCVTRQGQLEVMLEAVGVDAAGDLPQPSTGGEARTAGAAPPPAIAHDALRTGRGPRESDVRAPDAPLEPESGVRATFRCGLEDADIERPRAATR